MTIADASEQWRPALLHHAWGLCADPESAVQDGLIRCWRQELKGKTINRSYAYSAVHSAALDQRRRRPEILSLELVDPPVTEPDWDSGMEIERLLAAMAPEQAQIIRLYAEGYQGREIAAELDCTENAVRKLAHRGRARARKVA